MKPVLSICMMVKNEEKNLERCLQSLHPLRQAVSSELIIVDTGSTDQTPEIARQFTSKVFVHKWNNNFSEMRNISIGYATGQWVLIIDADEELQTADTLINFLKSHVDTRIGCATILVKNIIDDLNEQYTTLVSPRLFRRNKHFFYRGVVHNQPVFQGETIHLSECSILHYGYIASDKDLMERKFQRTSGLLRAELDKDPENLYYRYQLAISYSMHGDLPEALEELQKIYKQYKDADDEFWQKNLYIMAAILKTSVVNKFCDNNLIQFGLRAIKLAPDYVDLYFYIAQLYEIQEDFSAAYDYYVKHENMVKNFSELNLSRNTSLQFDTLSLLTIDYYSMGLISFRNGDYFEARKRLKQMLEIAAENDLLVSQAHKVIIELDFIKQDFTDSHEIYNKLLKQDSEQKLLKIESEIERLWKNAPGDVRQQFCRQFQDLPNLYGWLNRLRLNNGEITETEWESLLMMISTAGINSLPDYYAPVLAYILKFCPRKAWQVSARLSEENIVRYMIYLDEVDKGMFIDICREYINLPSDGTVNSYQTARLQKNIARYLLFSGELDENEYLDIFKYYIKHGRLILESIYSEWVFENELIYDLKSKEEIFLLYLTLAERSTDQRSYINYLRKALKAYPEMYKGIDGLLQSLKHQTDNGEMARLTVQLLNSLEKLVEAGQFEAALAFIDECQSIIGDDLRLFAIKTEILRKKYH